MKSTEVKDIINRHAENYERAVVMDAKIKSSNRNEVLLGKEDSLFNREKCSSLEN